MVTVDENISKGRYMVPIEDIMGALVLVRKSMTGAGLGRGGGDGA